MVREDRLSRGPPLRTQALGGTAMITGVVNADAEPSFTSGVFEGNGHAHSVDTVIDTGFNGFLTLPPLLIATLRLPYLFRQQAMLADGSLQVFDVHSATVLWDGQQLAIEVESTDSQPLIGMALL